VTILNVFSVARTTQNLFKSRISKDNNEDPELLALDGFKVGLFLWFSVYIMGMY
jgi:hypothetical protein